IFNNLIRIWASSMEIDEGEDRRLAEKARLNLDIIIPELYAWLLEECVDHVLRDRINCTRAVEAPFKKTAAYDNSMPVCARAKGNKHCTVERAIRERGPALIAKLQATLEGGAESEQLARS